MSWRIKGWGYSTLNKTEETKQTNALCDPGLGPGWGRAVEVLLEIGNVEC